MNNTQNTKLTLPFLFEESVRKNGDRIALGIVQGTSKTYAEMHSDVLSLMSFLEKLNIKQGDKVAILSSNMPNWGIAYLAITSMGAVAVPILPEFSATEISTILQHSETKLVFVSKKLLYKVNVKAKLEHFIAIENFSHISGKEAAYFEFGLKPFGTYKVDEEDIASIIYTSGTTGKSKGVMLSHKNLTYNALKTKKIQTVNAEDRLLSILPLSHAYENTLGFILPIISGASVFYLGNAPTPSVLLPALKEVKPTLMLSVPMVIEKIYKNKILPSFQKNIVIKLLYTVPIIRKRLNRIAGSKLKETFGGNLKFFGIGGAKLNRRVEKFLQEAKFPYAIGYGLTETSPLLAGCNPQNTILQSTGKNLEGIELKIHNPDKKTGEGEIWAKGPSVMKGYYKEPGLTNAVLTPDGWFKTGDLGVFDKNNNLFIKGRLKNMIVGNTGENIYPEDIESIINNYRHVVESLVMEKKGKIVALVHFNKEEIENKYRTFKGEVTNYFDTKVEELRSELLSYINSRVSRFSRIQSIYVHLQPFEKTPTQKIKRFLYKKQGKI
ncbi:MAG: AMP-binding protein [Bacteroidales bacterium]